VTKSEKIDPKVRYIKFWSRRQDNSEGWGRSPGQVRDPGGDPGSGPRPGKSADRGSDGDFIEKCVFSRSGGSSPDFGSGRGSDPGSGGDPRVGPGPGPGGTPGTGEGGGKFPPIDHFLIRQVPLSPARARKVQIDACCRT